MAKKIKPLAVLGAGSVKSPQIPRKMGPILTFTSFWPVRNLCIALSVVCFLLYADTLPNGYVMDDVIVLKENTIVKKGLAAIPELFRTPHMHGYLIIPNDMYRPLSMVMFAVEYQFFGANPMVGHFFNILVFIGCVIMLFLFLDQFFDGKKTSIAFIAALLFAIHPIHTEVVANIKSRDELLCFFFAFWSLRVFVIYMKSGRLPWLLAGMAALFLAYLAKETVITFLGIIPLLFFFYKNENKKRAIYITVSTIVIAGIYLALRASVLTAYHANEPAAIDFIDNALVSTHGLVRFTTEIVIMGRYLWLQFIPYPLLSTYSYNAIPFASIASILFWASLAAYLLLFYIALRGLTKRDKNPFAFAILFYMISLALFSNIPFLMGAEMAERFAFFASAGFCLAAALAIDKWIIKTPASNSGVLRQPKVLAVLAPVFLLFSCLTIARNADWKDNYTLYKADIEKSPENSRLYHYLATALAEDMYPVEPDSTRRLEMDRESIGYLKKGLDIYPGFTEAHVELGRVYDRNHLYDSAIVEDKKALALNPGHATANNNLGSIYLTTGKYVEAVDLFKKSIVVNPLFPFAYFNLARTYVQLKMYDSAILYFNRMLSFDPNYFDAEQEMGLCYFYEQKYDSAAVHFRLAITIKPEDANAYNSLGAVYLNAKNYSKAIEILQKAVTLSPGNTNSLSNLGRAYFLSDQFVFALQAFNKELTLDPKSPRDIPYVALAYQKTGNVPLALKYEAIARQYYNNFKLP